MGAYILLIFLLCLLIIIRYFQLRATKEGFVDASASASAAALANAQTRINKQITDVRATASTFFTQTYSMPVLPERQSFLVNMCPLTAYLGGYLGPTEQVMNATYYVETAIKAGIRSFILPISTYINESKVPPDWPYSGEPIIACRDASDTIVSINAISLTQFINALLEYRIVSGYGSEPILLYIEDALSPAVKNKINYVSFMNKIATSLALLNKYRLTSVGSYGSVIGGAKQAKLLTEIPISVYNDKVLIFTDFDIQQDSALNLASYVNFSYSYSSKTDMNPVRTIALEDIAGSTVNYVTNARTNWYIAKSRTPLTVPTAAVLANAFTNGIQCIPIPFISASMADIKDIWNLWKGSSYKAKDEKSRYTQPEPVVPSKVSTKLNASIQGKEPGNLVVS